MGVTAWIMMLVLTVPVVFYAPPSFAAGWVMGGVIAAVLDWQKRNKQESK